jgi:hypothetical protein
VQALSASFTAILQTVSPSFLLFGATRYIAATHTNGFCSAFFNAGAGATLSLPASLGEIIVLFGVGFGLPAASSRLINDSSSQSGDLPVLPVIQIGGVTANVTFAGLVKFRPARRTAISPCRQHAGGGFDYGAQLTGKLKRNLQNSAESAKSAAQLKNRPRRSISFAASWPPAGFSFPSVARRAMLRLG